MDREQLRSEVQAELERAEREAGGRSGEDWTIELADRLREPLGRLLGQSFSRARLTSLLWTLEDEHDAAGTRRPFASFAAEQLLDRLVPREGESLSLYYIPGCPFSRRVLRSIDDLGADVELRNIWEDKRWRHELLDARGTTTVPVLRCSAGGKDRWMPESRDIVAYLEKRFGRQQAGVG